MRISKAMSCAITSSIGIAILAGCSGGSSGTTPHLISAVGAIGPGHEIIQDGQFALIPFLHRGIASSHRVTTPSFLDPDAKGKPLIFAADYQNNVVNIYLQADTNKMVGRITGLNGLNALATDASSNLYIAEGPVHNEDILVYAPPYTGPPKLVLNDANYYILGVAVSSQGVVAVANLCLIASNGNCSNPLGGNVTFYAKNSSKPCAVAASPSTFPSVLSAAFATNGSLYITGTRAIPGATFPGVAEISGGCNAKKITPLTNTGTIYYGAIKMDKANRIAILNFSSSSSGPWFINTYDRPKRGPLGNPVSSITLAGVNSYDPDFAFLQSGADLYTADILTSTSFVNEYDYRTGGKAENAIPVAGVLAAVAVTPPLVP